MFDHFVELALKGLRLLDADGYLELMLMIYVFQIKQYLSILWN